MLPKTHRFSPRVEAQDFFRQARIVGVHSIAVYYQRASEVKNWKATVIVSKKIASSAVVRNKMKRVLRMATRTILDEIDQEKFGVQLAIVAKPAILKRDSADIIQDVRTALLKLFGEK